ncbi:serine-rich adhesin for platelets-like isoform X2 [Haliotis asinina]
MSSLDATSGPGSDDWSGEDEDDGGTEGSKRSYSHPNFMPGCHVKREDAERDSGLPSSGKGAGSWCDLEGSDLEERGAYDYFYPDESIKKNDAVKISHTVNPDFDEVIDVESDKSSIESPRSDASSTNEYNVTSPLDEDGIEMKTFSHQEIPQGDIHKALYGKGDHIPYSVLQNESDDEEYCHTEQQRRFMSSDCTMTRGTRSVDDGVCFPFNRNNRYSSYSRTPEEAESGGFQKHGTFLSCKPPFGYGEEQLTNVGGSIARLLPSTNMSTGTDIGEDGKKKKGIKKKKGMKDDADERVSSSKTRNSCHDINGNPIAPSAYRQMREPPNKSVEGSLVSSRKPTNYGTYPQHPPEFPRETSNFDPFPFQGQSVKDLEDGSSSTDRKKPRKKTHKEPVKLSEDIPNYVGNIASVDDLVKFIETHKFGEKQLKKKVSQKSSPGSEIAAKADKAAKKNKEKKIRVGQADETNDSHNESVELVNSPTAVTSEAPPSPIPPADAAAADACPVIAADEEEEEDMGNYGDKAAATSVVESQAPLEDSQSCSKPDTKCVLNKDIEPLADKISSSKSPPLHKREVDPKDKNKTKNREKEKSVETVPPSSVENKKQKGKNGKSEGQLRNNKKLENKNDIINNTKTLDKMKLENGPTRMVSNLDSDDLAITENHQDYIFTDIDNLPPVEQEFTLVSKKKKRPGAKDVVPEIPRQKNGPRENRGLPQPRSVTPPPISSLLKKEQTRDLSPSAFPALGKKANAAKSRPTFREGRRNSFGDVPIDTLTELRSQDDSDIESVKSLPAAKGGSLSEFVSRFPVSYAKMAAAPKPPNSPTSPKAEEEEPFDSQSENSNSRKPTIWKGSPTERRHSIGSSPEDTKQENSPKLTQRSRQKSGSQEFLLSDPVVVDKDVSVPASVDVETSSVSVSDSMVVKSSNSSSDNTVSEDTLSSVTPSGEQPSSSSNDSQPIPTITVTFDSKMPGIQIVKSENPNGPKNGPPNGPKNGPKNGPQRAIKAEVLNYTESSRSQHAVNLGSVSKDTRSKQVSVSARVGGNNGKKNNKSVIFLDKRFGEAPENLGITFGFDSNFEHDVKSTCDNDHVTTSVNNIQQEGTSCERKDSVNHNQSEPQSIPVTLPKDISNKSEPTAPKPSETPSQPTPNNGGGAEVLPGSSISSSTSSSTTKMSKTRVGGLNGVVLPKTQGYRNSHGSDALRTEHAAVSSETKLSAAAAAAAAAASSSKDNNKTVFVFYGDGIVAKLQNSNVSVDSRDAEPPPSPTSQHKGQLAFSPDANHRGKFNVSEAVAYLKKEWDKVLEQKDKNPQAVQFYDGQ